MAKKQLLIPWTLGLIFIGFSFMMGLSASNINQDYTVLLIFIIPILIIGGLLIYSFKVS